MEVIEINWLAVFLAALSSFVIGGVWYSALFAKRWQKLAGVSDANLTKGRVRAFAVSFITSVVMALNLAFFIGNNGVMFGAFAGFAVGFGWIAMAFGMNYLFERRPFGLYAINAGYNILTLTLMGVIIGVL